MPYKAFRAMGGADGLAAIEREYPTFNESLMVFLPKKADGVDAAGSTHLHEAARNEVRNRSVPTQAFGGGGGALGGIWRIVEQVLRMLCVGMLRKWSGVKT